MCLVNGEVGSARDSGPGGSRSRAFNAFLCAVLASNLLGSAFIASASWLVGSPALPPWLPLANQAVAVGGIVVGAALGARIARRVDFGVGIAGSSVIEALLALIPVAAVAVASGSSEASLAVAVIVGNGAVAFASGVTGPLWIAAIHTWPDAPGSSTSRIAKEAAIFQVGKVAGPVLAGLALGSIGERSSLIVLSAANSASFLLVAAVMFSVVRKSRFGRDGMQPREAVGGPQSSRIVRASVLVAALAIASDAARAYLPRLLQEDGVTPSLGGLVLACIAAGAAASGLLTERALKVMSTRRLMLFGFIILVCSLALWWLGGSTVVWVLGAVLGGFGMSVTYSTIVSTGLDGSLQPAGLAGQIRVAKTLSGLFGAALIAACVAASGPILLFPVLAAIAGGVIAGRGRDGVVS